MPKKKLLDQLEKVRDFLFDIQDSLLLKIPAIEQAIKTIRENIAQLASLSDKECDIAAVNTHTTRSAECIEDCYTSISQQFAFTIRLYALKNISSAMTESPPLSLDNLSQQWKRLQLSLIRPNASLDDIERWCTIDKSIKKHGKQTLKHHQPIIVDSDDPRLTGNVKQLMLEMQLYLSLTITFKQLQEGHKSLSETANELKIVPSDLVDASNERYLEWKTEYDQLTSEANQIIHDLETKIKAKTPPEHDPHHPGGTTNLIRKRLDQLLHGEKEDAINVSDIPYDPIFAQEVLSANEALNTINLRRNAIKKELLDYKNTFSLIENDMSQLEATFQNEYATYLKTLTALCTSFCMIETDPSDFKAMKTLYEPAKQWIDTLEKTLASSKFIDNSKANQLITTLRTKLEGSHFTSNLFKSFTTQKDSKRQIPSVNLESILQALFSNSTHRDTSSTAIASRVKRLFKNEETAENKQQHAIIHLKEKILFIRQLTQNMPLDILRYQEACTMRQEFLTQQKQFQTTYTQHQSHHNKVQPILKAYLAKYRTLAALVWPHTTTQAACLQIFHTLLQRLENLTKEHSAVEKIKTQLPLFQTPKDMDDLAEQKTKMTNYRAKITRHHTNYEYNTQDITEENLSIHYTATIDFYNKELSTFYNTLKSQLKTTNAALDFQKEHNIQQAEASETTDATQAIKDSEKALRKYQNHQDVCSPLPDIQKDMHTHEKKLENIVQAIKNAITQTIITKQKNDIDQKARAISEQNIKDIHSINPFRTALSDAFRDYLNAKERYSSAINNFPDTQPEDWSGWYITLQSKKTAFDEAIATHKQRYDDAQEIEIRIASKEFKASNQVLRGIEAEISRIFEHHIEERSLKIDLSTEDKTRLWDILINGRENGSYFAITSNDKIKLKKVDQRLEKLLTLHHTFRMLNDKFISRTYTDYPLDIFKTELKQAVKDNLQTAAMEDFSDGIKSRAYQQFRRHVLKPLIQLFHRPHRHDFFYVPQTWGASKTERWAIKTGNELAETLQIMRPTSR